METHSETMRDRKKGMRDSAGRFFSTIQDAGKIQSGKDAKIMIDVISDSISKQVDLEHILKVAGPPDTSSGFQNQSIANTPDITIGIVRDEAFGFYYQDDLEEFENNGAKLVFIDSMKSR